MSGLTTTGARVYKEMENWLSGTREDTRDLFLCLGQFCREHQDEWELEEPPTVEVVKKEPRRTRTHPDLLRAQRAWAEADRLEAEHAAEQERIKAEAPPASNPTVKVWGGKMGAQLRGKWAQ